MERLRRPRPSKLNERRRKQSIFLRAAKWIASRSLSSGARSRDPLARNDDVGLFEI
jgi:hypothetical protein